MSAADTVCEKIWKLNFVMLREGLPHKKHYNGNRATELEPSLSWLQRLRSLLPHQGDTV